MNGHLLGKKRLARPVHRQARRTAGHFDPRVFFQPLDHRFERAKNALVIRIGRLDRSVVGNIQINPSKDASLFSVGQVDASFSGGVRVALND